MWSESLIESMGGQTNGKRWLTVQLAAIVHAAIVGVLVAGSFWCVDRMSLPLHDKIPAVIYEQIPGGLPAELGIRRPPQHTTQEMPKAVPAETPLVQEEIVPETIDNISDIKVADALASESNLSAGDPEGITGGDPNSKARGGFGGSEGDGIAATPLNEQIHKITRGVDLPEIINQVKPEYPELLRRSRKEGIVVLEAVITKAGLVKDVRVIQSAHPLFAQSASRAVLQWKYRPAIFNGKPIAVYFNVTVKFTLH